MHKIRLISLFIAFGFIATALIGCSRGGSGVVTVNGQKISKDDYYRRLEMAPLGNRPTGLVTANKMIYEKLVMQLADKEGVVPTDADIQKKIDFLKKTGKMQNLNIPIDQFKKDLRVEQATLNVITKGIKVSDEEVKKRYEALKGKEPITNPEKVQLQVVACQTEDKIREVYKKIQGGTDFTIVSQTMTDDPNVKRVGGNLGWVWKDHPQIPAKLVEAVLKVKTNDVSEPFLFQQEKGGPFWVIVKAAGRQPKRVLSFADAEDQIRELIAAEKSEVDFTKLMAEEFKNASIKVTSTEPIFKTLAKEIAESQKDTK